MFTAALIHQAKARVRSGADYPRLVQELKRMGITKYDHFVSDGSTVYFGTDNSMVRLPETHDVIPVKSPSSLSHFKKILAAHQAGKTDHATFCHEAAEAGVERWIADLGRMTVSYVNRAGQTMLVEKIPALDNSIAKNLR
jgi:uncharacterized protein YbcV (DUF1398 family)